MRRVIAIHRNSGWPEAQAGGTVTLSYLDRHRRRLRLSADDGTPFLLDLPRATVLGEGDGLELEGGGFLRVRAAAEALAEITCRDGAELARIAWHLGNRHLPAEIADDVILIRDDHVIIDMLERLGARVRRVRHPFNPEGGAYGQHNHDPAHPHRHAEGHDADHG